MNNIVTRRGLPMSSNHQWEEESPTNRTDRDRKLLEREKRGEKEYLLVLRKKKKN